MNLINGSSRREGLLLPEFLDDYIEPDSPVRFLDEFVESLDLESLGFQFPKTDQIGHGRPGYILKPFSSFICMAIYMVYVQAENLKGRRN